MLGVNRPVARDYVTHLQRCQGYGRRRLLAPSVDLLPPEFALVVMMKGQRLVDLFQDAFALGAPHQDRCGHEDEMPLRMNYNINIDCFKISRAFEAVPITNCLANGLTPPRLLNPVMPDVAFDD